MPISAAVAPSRLELRDYFAGQALAGMTARHWPTAEVALIEQLAGNKFGNVIAESAYCYADAMLAARIAGKVGVGNG